MLGRSSNDNSIGWEKCARRFAVNFGNSAHMARCFVVSVLTKIDDLWNTGLVTSFFFPQLSLGCRSNTKNYFVDLQLSLEALKLAQICCWKIFCAIDVFSPRLMMIFFDKKSIRSMSHNTTMIFLVTEPLSKRHNNKSFSSSCKVYFLFSLHKGIFLCQLM